MSRLTPQVRLPCRLVTSFIRAIYQARSERGAALMGVLNVTPDSFYDGGRYETVLAAERRVDELLAQGADIIDIGGESSRPGADPVGAAEQLDRITPAVRKAIAMGALVSVDTTDPDVAEEVLRLGVHAINDVSCLANPDLARVVGRAGGFLVLMHTRGTLGSMAGFSEYPDDGYNDVVAEVRAEWCQARDRAAAAGVTASHVLCDPGLGFAKNARQTLTLLAHLGALGSVDAPIVVGPSRKSFINAADPSPPAERLGGSIAACLIAVEQGASVLRVHDVQSTRQALLVARAVTSATTARGRARA